MREYLLRYAGTDRIKKSHYRGECAYVLCLGGIFLPGGVLRFGLVLVIFPKIGTHF